MSSDGSNKKILEPLQDPFSQEQINNEEIKNKILYIIFSVFDVVTNIMVELSSNYFL